MRRRDSIRLSAVAFALAVGVPRPARADNANSAAAQALFDQARHMMEQGKFEAACPKLEESQRLDPASGTLINLADCYDHEGKTATAWSTFLEAAAASDRVGNAARERVARARAAELQPKLSKLVIDVAPPSRITGLSVTRDGQSVDPPLWGTPIPIDPGTHTIVATAPGHAKWQYLVAVQPGPSRQTVEVPVLKAQPASAPAPSPTRGGSPPAPGNGRQEKGGGLGAGRTLALVAAGVGVIGVGVGTVFGLESKSKHDEAAKHCDGSLCRDQTGVDLKSGARSAGNVSTVAFVVGGVGLAGAAVLWFTAGNGSAHTEVGLGPSGVSLRGIW